MVAKAETISESRFRRRFLRSGLRSLRASSNLQSAGLPRHARCEMRDAGCWRSPAGGKKQYYLDQEIALYLLGSGNNGRYYDAATGRFLSEDPTKQDGTSKDSNSQLLTPNSSADVNLYCYTGNDPINNLDPSGHSLVTDPPKPVYHPVQNQPTQQHNANVHSKVPATGHGTDTAVHGGTGGTGNHGHAGTVPSHGAAQVHAGKATDPKGNDLAIKASRDPAKQAAFNKELKKALLSDNPSRAFRHDPQLVKEILRRLMLALPKNGLYFLKLYNDPKIRLAIIAASFGSAAGPDAGAFRTFLEAIRVEEKHPLAGRQPGYITPQDIKRLIHRYSDSTVVSVPKAVGLLGLALSVAVPEDGGEGAEGDEGLTPSVDGADSPAAKANQEGREMGAATSEGSTAAPATDTVPAKAPNTTGQPTDAGPDRMANEGGGQPQGVQAKVAKAPPNPHGKLGGPAHQAEVEKVVQDIKNRGLTPEVEHKVSTPGGDKGSRYVDVVAKDKQGKVVEAHQVGRQTKSGLPVSRERAAIRDIEKARGVKVKFHRYE